MTNPQPTQAVISLYDRFTHGSGISRREMFAQMARLAGGTAAASAMLGLIAASANAAPLVAADDAHLYAGVNHSFNNDTSPARYHKPNADLAWQRTLKLLKG